MRRGRAISERIAVRGARVVDAAGIREQELVLDVSSGTFSDSSASEGARVVDASGLLALPGCVDVHTHGGGGFALHTTDPQRIRDCAAWAPSSGTTAFLIAVVGVAGRPPLAELSAAVAAIEQPGPGAEPLGIHLEGPYINPARRGAHPPEWLRLPDATETEQILATCRGHLRLVTLAPELPGAPAMIQRLREAGVTVSIGHTEASYAATREAIALGVSHATHCFNAMPALLHRDPGPLGAIVETEGVRGELIADGVHVHPAVMRVLIRALGPERTVVVTDAQPPARVCPREGESFDFAGQPARVAGGTARLADGTIAGSILTMIQALRNLVERVGVPLPEAVAMVSRNPAAAVGAGDRKGALRPGYDADLLLVDPALRLQATYCRGQLAFATADWRARLEDVR